MPFSFVKKVYLICIIESVKKLICFNFIILLSLLKSLVTMVCRNNNQTLQLMKHHKFEIIHILWSKDVICVNYYIKKWNAIYNLFMLWTSNYCRKCNKCMYLAGRDVTCLSSWKFISQWYTSFIPLRPIEVSSSSCFTGFLEAHWMGIKFLYQAFLHPCFLHSEFYPNFFFHLSSKRKWRGHENTSVKESSIDKWNKKKENASIQKTVIFMSLHLIE